jgi:hypothetical protein
MSEAPQGARHDRRHPAAARRLALASRLSLGWERLWPRLWLPLGIVLAFLAVSWFGLWTHLPWYGRVVGVLASPGPSPRASGMSPASSCRRIATR